MYVSVVVPCYRSAGTLPELVARLEATLPRVTEGYEVVLVVDGSPDDTWDTARRLALRVPAVRAIRLARNYGQHNALLAGVRAARHEVVVTMDDDLQHPPEEVPKLLEALTDDVDLVYGVAREEEHGVARSLASRLVKAGLASLLDVPDGRVMSAFRAFRTVLRAGFERVGGPHVSVDVCLLWGTSQVGSVVVEMQRRRTGRSGYTLRALMRYAINVITGYSTAPLRLVTYTGFGVGVGGLALFIWVMRQYVSGATKVAGFTTIAGMLAVLAAIQMLALGVLGVYVGRLHDRGMGRPAYIVRERVERAGTAPSPQVTDVLDARPAARGQ